MDCCTHPQDTTNVAPISCATEKTQASERCPSCQTKGRAVGSITMKALLTSRALRGLTADPYRFCSSPDCNVVYFAGQAVFRTEDVTAPVWQKSSDSSVFVCYCFEHSQETIRQELIRAGESTVSSEITRLVREGKCACEVRNPQGTCCLGNVNRVVAMVQTDVAARPAGDVHM